VARRTRRDRSEQRPPVSVEAPQDEPRPRPLREAADRRNPTVGRQVDVDEREIRCLVQNRALEPSVVRGLFDLEAAFSRQDVPDAGAEDRRRIRDNDPGPDQLTRS
jgi:hypothetical protein